MKIDRILITVIVLVISFTIFAVFRNSGYPLGGFPSALVIIGVFLVVQIIANRIIKKPGKKTEENDQTEEDR